MEPLEVKILVQEKLTEEQKEKVDLLTKEAFSDISQEEADEDFFLNPISIVLAYVKDDIVGYAGIYHTEVTFEGTQINIGGIGGVCTKEELRGKGIALSVCKKALEYLRSSDNDIVFLTVDLAKGTNKLYEKLGFKLLQKRFIWQNIHGDLDSDFGGMIAPLNDKKVFEEILMDNKELYVGKGIW